MNYEVFSHVMMRYFVVFFLLWISAISNAQTLIRGQIKDFGSGDAVDNVNVRNIYTMVGMTTMEDGTFQVRAKKGELIEFSKMGYQTLRIRIHNEQEPSYYHLVMNKAPRELREVDIRGKPLDFKADSVRYRSIYNVVLSNERQHEVDMRSMPLAMLSKKNREEWAFQQMYEEWEKEKYIDFTFNERLVSRITYLKGDALKEFMKTFRPSYTFLKTASEYEYLEYIKHAYMLYMRHKKQAPNEEPVDSDE